MSGESDGNERTEMDEYLASHRYLDVATSDMQRLVMWIMQQPEKNVLLEWLNGALGEAEIVVAERLRNSR